ncbi:hypothetical protein [Streptomyces rishiriensis]|uniref:hypothetical protein n=1 Tax=Streptomyces rishiriensis TaxID=68264 RepID=UPI0037D744A7
MHELLAGGHRAHHRATSIRSRPNQNISNTRGSCGGGFSTTTLPPGRVTGSYRLVTTLTDAGRLPAAVLVGLYHQRWEHESAYYAFRHTLMNGRVLRSGDPAGVEQEMWALLTLYQALRTMMVEAAESLPGTDPDRCCSPSPSRPPATRSSRPPPSSPTLPMSVA